MYITTTGWYDAKKCTAQITKRKNRLKVYPKGKEDLVFLKDEEEFEIELFNPKTSPVLAKISLNGKKISDRGIILYPGQRIFLERFIDSPEKFKFSTYRVNNSEEVKEAISLNGLVKIEFYDEHNPFTITTSSGTTINTVNTTTPIFGGTTVTNLYNVNSTYTASNSSFFNVSKTNGLSTSLNKRSDSIETGRVDKGEKSSQEFTLIDKDFSPFISHSVEFKIVPINEKPVEISEVRSYCTNCGIRNKKDWKFCPSCGQKF